MIKDFVKRFMAAKPALEAEFAAGHPSNYKSIVQSVVKALNPDDAYNLPSAHRIEEIDHGEYQGTLVYVIGESGYQPSTYWYVRVWYGSCSGCDTLERIRDAGDDYFAPPNSEQVKQYMTLALHIVQRMKEMDDVEGENT